MVRVSFATVVVRLGSVPAFVSDFTVVVEPAFFTLIVGASTDPPGL